MNKFNPTSFSNGEAAESVTVRGLSSAQPYRSAAIDDSSRLTDLELENTRLHRLVAELLLKNQQLRKQAEA
jgi:hypothetical protein